MHRVLPAILTNDFQVARSQLAILCDRKLPAHIDVIESAWGDTTLTIEDWLTIKQETAAWPEYVEWHLMVDNSLVVVPLLKLHAQAVIIHTETVTDGVDAKRAAAEAGLKLIYSTKPNTVPPLDWVCDGWQIMGVEPGKSGQSQLPDTPQRLAAIRQSRRDTILSVDGGVNLDNAQALVAAGADSLVVNSTFWQAQNPQSVIEELTSMLAGGERGVSGSD